MKAPISSLRFVTESIPLSDLDLFGSDWEDMARTNDRQEITVHQTAITVSEHLMRTALTAGGSGTGADFASTSQIIPGATLANAPILARTEIVPALAAQIAAGSLTTRPVAQTVAENTTMTENTAATARSTISHALRIEAWFTASRQFLRETGNEPWLTGELRAAVAREIEKQVMVQWLGDARIATASGALSAAVVNGMVTAHARESGQYYAVTSPAGWLKASALNAATFSVDAQSIGGVPWIVSPGISEVEGGSTNETAFYIAEPSASVIALFALWDLRDPYTYKKSGLVEFGSGALLVPMVRRPWMVQRRTGIVVP